MVNNDERVKDAIKVTFLPDYRVSLATLIIPGADLSEQISTAGMEASGTGNMKLAMNGALTIGTWDGANIEIAEEVGLDNIFIFGLRAEEILEMQKKGTYNPRERYDNDPDGQGSHGRPRLRPLLSQRARPVPLDLRRTRASRRQVLPHRRFPQLRRDPEADRERIPQDEIWCRKAILNVARIGKFSSDRTVLEYARDIWHIGPYEKSVSERQSRPANRTSTSCRRLPVLNGEAIP